MATYELFPKNLSQFLLKYSPHEFGRFNAPFSESTLLKDDYVLEDFQNKVDKAEKESSRHFEARGGTKSGVKMILQILHELGLTIMNDEEIRFLDELGRFYITRSLELRSFVFKVMLRRIDMTRENDKEKHTNFQDLQNAIHNAQEVIKKRKYLIPKVGFQEDSRFSGRQSTLVRVLTKVREEKEKAQFKMTEEDYKLLKSDTAQLCSLLGLKLDFLDGFEEMAPEHRHHRTMADWIKISLKDNAVKANENSLSKEMLQSIGFDPSSAAIKTVMARSEFQGSMEQHMEACEWAQLFVEDEFKYNPLLSPPTPMFPFRCSLTNTWFDLTSIPDKERESNINFDCVRIINLPTTQSNACSNAQAKLSESPALPQDDQNIVLYHGTDHESARQILLRGIYLYAGRQRRDFSSGKGFYLTNRIDNAWNWAKSLSARPAILSFVVSREYMENKPRKLDLKDDEEKWKKMVSSFRNDKVTAKMLEDLDQSYDLIEGPIARVTKSEASDELECKAKPSSYQLCLISEKFAEDFEKTLHSIIFFDIS